MKKSICGVDCNNCDYGKNVGCMGCTETEGCPFGKKCFIAKYINAYGVDSYNSLKVRLSEEFNELNICGMSKINELFPLNGAFVNLEYPMPNGKLVKFLDDKQIYLGNQVECECDETNKCYGLVAGENFLLVSKYGENGTDAEIIVYKKR